MSDACCGDAVEIRPPAGAAKTGIDRCSAHQRGNLCLSLLTPYRHADVNMASVWECSPNDVLEGCAVMIAAALGVWIFKTGWPDLAIAVALLLLFARSATRIMRNAARHLRETQRAVA